MNAKFLAATVFVGASFVAGTAYAQVTSIGTARAPGGNDPKRMVCERVEVTGSRLGARRVCLTAAQWAEKRREHREELERAQKNSGILPSS